MRLGLAAFTREGHCLLQRLQENRAQKECGDTVTVFDKEAMTARQWVKEAFFSCDALVFIGATGIAVRLIAPYLVAKDKDPAVIVIDEQGRFVIPLLSGHIGGANRLAGELAAFFDAEAVITTATDIQGVFAVDVWSGEQGCTIDDIAMIKHVSSRLLQGKPVGFMCDFPVAGALPSGLVRLADGQEPFFCKTPSSSSSSSSSSFSLVASSSPIFVPNASALTFTGCSLASVGEQEGKAAASQSEEMTSSSLLGHRAEPYESQSPNLPNSSGVPDAPSRSHPSGASAASHAFKAPGASDAVGTPSSPNLPSFPDLPSSPDLPGNLPEKAAGQSAHEPLAKNNLGSDFPEGLAEQNTKDQGAGRRTGAPPLPVGILVSLHMGRQPFPITLQVIPKIVILGAGCRKGVSAEDFESFVLGALREHHIPQVSLKTLASIDLKMDEECLLRFSEKYGLEFVTFSATTLNGVPGTYSPSPFVRKVTGVDNVCERAAVAAGGERLLLSKTVKNGMTLALAVPCWTCRFP